MVTWALYDVIKHIVQYSIHMLSHIDHGCHIQGHDYISPVTAISIQQTFNSLKMHTYGSWAFWLHNQTLPSTQHSHAVHNSPWIPHAKYMAYTSPVIVISIQIDHQFHPKHITYCFHGTWLHINHHCHTAFTCCSLIHHRFHMQASCFTSTHIAYLFK